MLRKILSVAAFLSLTAISGVAIADDSWKIVPNKEVCMVTDMHFGKPQIPVEQDGKTYFGCCKNCKATIEKDKTARTATDPITQKPVDKARAIIASNNQGEVLYFENKANFDKYKSQQVK